MAIPRAAPVLLTALLAGCDGRELTAPQATVPAEVSTPATATITFDLRVALAAASDDAVTRLVPAIGGPSETGALTAALRTLAMSLDRSGDVPVAIALNRADAALTRLEEATFDDPGRAANLAAIRLVLERVSAALE